MTTLTHRHLTIKTYDVSDSFCNPCTPVFYNRSGSSYWLHTIISASTLITYRPSSPRQLCTSIRYGICGVLGYRTEVGCDLIFTAVSTHAPDVCQFRRASTSGIPNLRMLARNGFDVTIPSDAFIRTRRLLHFVVFLRCCSRLRLLHCSPR